MNIRSALKHAAMGVPATTLAFGIAANANAVEIGCQPAAVVKAAIQKEGMKPIAVGNRLDGVGNANIFFANDKGYGFNVESDRPFGTPAQEEICVLGTYKGVRVNDPRNKELPSWVKIKSGDGATYTNFEGGYSKGSRIVVTAHSYKKGPNNTESMGKVIALYAGPDKLATVEGINSEGYSTAAFAMRDFSLTANANRFVAATPGTPETVPVIPPSYVPR